MIPSLIAHAPFFSPSAALLAAKISETKKIAERLASDIALASTAAVISNATNQQRPPYADLPGDIKLQLRRDGTRGTLRSHHDAEALYDSLPDSIDNIADVRAVVDSTNYEGGHIIPHAEGGTADANNITYMPTALNRQIGDRVPTPEELSEAASAVEAEGFLFADPLADNILGIAAGASAPAVFRLAGVGTKLAGGFIRDDQAATAQALNELPGELAKGLQESVTRGIPAAVGSAFGPVGFAAGFVASDFIEGAMATDPDKQYKCYANGALKAGVIAAGVTFPPFGAVIAIGYLGSKFLNW